MKRRSLLIAAGVAGLSTSLSATAQKAKTYRLGFLAPDRYDPTAEPFMYAMLDGLRQSGYEKDKNLEMKILGAEGRYERLPGLAAELIAWRPDVLAGVGTPSLSALKNATRTIPIVMVASGDALATGLVASLANSGNNLTGATFFGKELMVKRLQMLKDAVPGLRRVAVLVNADNQTTPSNMRALQEGAKSLKIELAERQVRAAADVAPAFESMRKNKDQAVAVFEDAVLYENAKAIADFALRQRLPAAGLPAFADRGGLIGYGANFLDMYRRAAYFIDKLFKGESPGKIPVERPTTFELVLNLKTSRALGIKLPQSILGSANRVIE